MARNTKGQFANKMTAQDILDAYKDQFRCVADNEAIIASCAENIEASKSKIEDLRKQANAMGFDFHEAPKEPQEDMSDPKNWRAGDLVQCVYTDGMTDMTKGKNYEINDIYGICISLVDDAGDVATRSADSRFKFHSRPTK